MELLVYLFDFGGSLFFLFFFRFSVLQCFKDIGMLRKCAWMGIVRKTVFELFILF